MPTVAEVNDPAFGWQFMVFNNLANGETGYSEHRRMTIYFTQPGVAGVQTRTLLGVGL